MNDEQLELGILIYSTISQKRRLLTAIIEKHRNVHAKKVLLPLGPAVLLQVGTTSSAEVYFATSLSNTLVTQIGSDDYGLLDTKEYFE